MAICRSISDRYSEAEALTHLGDTYQAAGRPNAALAAWRDAVKILGELDHPSAGDVRAKLNKCST